VNRRLRTLEDAVLKSESADGRGLKFEDPRTSESERDGQMDSGGGWRHERPPRRRRGLRHSIL